MPLLLGHRGSPRQCPENTIPSFQAALDSGLDGVEWDVRRLGDGTLVIHHDAALPGGGKLSELTCEGWPATLPTLVQALEWAADTGAFVNIELKFEGAAFKSAWVDDRVARTAQAVYAFGLGRRVLLSSFMPTQLRAARDFAPALPRGLLIHRAYPAPLLTAVMRWTGCAALHPTHEIVDAALMRQVGAHGWQVNAWTVNDAAEVRRLTALGVHGLIGDVPGALLAART